MNGNNLYIIESYKNTDSKMDTTKWNYYNFNSSMRTRTDFITYWYRKDKNRLIRRVCDIWGSISKWQCKVNINKAMVNKSASEMFDLDKIR